MIDWSPASLSQSLSLINPLVSRVLLFGNVSSLILVTYFSLSVSQSHQPSCTPCLVVWKRFFSDIGHLLLSLSLSVSSTLLYPVSCCLETFLPWYWSPTSLSQSLSLINPLVSRVLLFGNVSSLILVTYFSLSVSQSHQPSCTPCLVVWKRFFPDIGHLLLSLSLSVSSTLLYPVSCCLETFLPWYWSPTSLSQSLSLINPLVPRVLLFGNVSSLILVTYFSLSLSLSVSSTLLYPVSCCLETFLPWYWSPTSLSQSLSLINPLVPRVLLVENVSSLILVTYFCLSLSLSVSSTLLYPVSCCWETFLPWYWSPTSLSLSQSLSLINPLVPGVLLLGNVSSLILVTYFSLSLSVSQSHQPSCTPCLVVGKRFFPDIGHLLLSLSLSLSVSSTLL